MMKQKWKQIIAFFQYCVNSTCQSALQYIAKLADLLSPQIKVESVKVSFKNGVNSFIKSAKLRQEELVKKLSKYKKLSSVNVKNLVNIMEKVQEMIEKEKGFFEQFLKQLKESPSGKKISK